MKNNHKLQTKNYPLVVIVGETASGKSALALELAQKFNGELICADSWTVRCEVNIGTAKPSNEEQKLVQHHLLDVVGPCEDFTAAVFKRLAVETIEDIASRGRLPIMVGGTGLYIDGVLFDYGFLPAGPKEQRQELNSMTIAKLLALAKKRKLNITNIDIRNKRRIIRLLETGGQNPSRGSMRPNTLVIGLKIKPEDLKKQIEQRVHNMIKRGLEGEVRALSEKYGWGCEALKGIGYKEWMGYFNGEHGIDEVVQKIIKASNQLAKRQRTWFKRNKSIHWVENQANAVKLTTEFLNK